MMKISTGECVASATNPSTEMEIYAQRSGWAEQEPEMWWEYVKQGIAQVGSSASLNEVVSIGITYQMHGLVVLDKSGNPTQGDHLV